LFKEVSLFEKVIFSNLMGKVT